MTKQRTLVVFALIACLVLANAYECGHGRRKVIPQKNTKKATNSTGEGRRLQEYESIRIVMDYSQIEADTSAPLEARNYLTRIIMPAAEAYFEQALKVIRESDTLVLEDSGNCFEAIPEYLTTDGVEADLVIKVTGQDTDENWLAGASTCLQSPENNRPIYGEIEWNYNSLNYNDELLAENDILTGLHELMHVFGLSDNLYEYFWDNDNDEVLTGHTGTVTKNDIEYHYVNVEPLTTKLRDHFDCDTIEGAYLENQGDSGSAGSHWERRIFYNEFMTANDIVDARISEFSLALLEGTGWYEVDYDMGDPFVWGKDQGCDFYFGPCLVAGDPPTNNFDGHYCTDIEAYACTFTGTHIGYCGTEEAVADDSVTDATDYFQNGNLVSGPYIDNCPIVFGYPDSQCINPDAAQDAYLGTDYETYGSGAKCFTGSLGENEAYDGTMAYCFSQECNNAGDEVTVTIGDVEVVCTEAGEVTVDGLEGVFNCPDPASWCENEGLSYCKRGCLGQGECVDGVCECDEGFSGDDCLWNDEVDLEEDYGSGSESEEESSSAAMLSSGLTIIFAVFLMIFQL